MPILSLSLTLMVLTVALIMLAWVIRKERPPEGERTGTMPLFSLVTGAMINTGPYALELLSPEDTPMNLPPAVPGPRRPKNKKD